MLEGLKDENGQIKKPILYSLIGGAALVGYLLLKGSGSSSSTTSSTGTDSSLSDAISALQTAVQGLGSSSGGGSTTGGTGGTGSTGGGTVPLPTGTTGSGTTTLSAVAARIALLQKSIPILTKDVAINKKAGKTAAATTDAATLSKEKTELAYLLQYGSEPPTMSPGIAVRAGDNGSAGGGGQGLVTVATMQSTSGLVYAGLTHDQILGSSAPTPIASRTSTPIVATKPAGGASTPTAVPRMVATA